MKGLSPQENRELRGVIMPPDIIDSEQRRVGDNGSLQIQVDYFNDTIEETQEELNQTEDTIKRIKLNKRIKGLQAAKEITLRQKQLEEVREQQEEDISRLQRIKEWVKENWKDATIISSLVISIAGIITTVVVGARKAIVKGAQATNKLANAVYNTLKKIADKIGPVLGPVLSALGSILSTLLSWGAKGLAWLANNMWLLVIAIVWFIYDQYKERRKK